MTLHDVTTCPSTGYVVTLHGVNCYITVLLQCISTFTFCYSYVIIINKSNMITVTIFQLIIYTAFNLSWINNTNADFAFMITY
jgi:hypothetical protein